MPAGTGLFSPTNSTTVLTALTDNSNNAILIECTAALMPTGAGYAVGCLAIATDTGVLYTNIGTTTNASFSAVADSSGTGPIKTTITQTSATPGNVKAIWGTQVLAASTTSGTVIGVRGETDIPNSGTVGSGVYLFGTQGKIVAGTSTTIDVGSAHVAGVYGQLDISGATTTSGHIAPVISSLQDSKGIARPAVNGFYAELPAYGSGALMNSVLQGVGAANYGIDLGGIGGMTELITMPSSVAGSSNGSGADVYIEVLINGVKARLVAKYVA